MRAHSQRGQSRRPGDGSLLRTVAPPACELEDAPLGRCEAQALLTRAVATDPYAAWLERREAEQRLRERPDVRWVYRYPPNAAKLSGAPRGGTREAPAVRGPGTPADGLVSVG
jgi:hypothetical protein